MASYSDDGLNIPGEASFVLILRLKNKEYYIIQKSSNQASANCSAVSRHFFSINLLFHCQAYLQLRLVVAICFLKTFPKLLP